MKPALAVEENRRRYHAAPNQNTVHRSSLLAPDIPDARLEVSFLNHFLLKRQIPAVACRVSATEAGEVVASKTFTVDEPRVYRVAPAEFLGLEDGANAYQVEFFAAENLFIPFPAAMVNHITETNVNHVHSYSRVLNDAFEDRAVNGVQVAEASFDVVEDQHTAAFFTIGGGPNGTEGELVVENRSTGDITRPAVSLAPLEHRTYQLRDLLTGGISTGDQIRIRQPETPMYYGRMFVGNRHVDGGLSANHSYYDSSEVEEYWPIEGPSWRTYAVLPHLRQGFSFHPITSPGTYRLTAHLHRPSGASTPVEIGELTSPSSTIHTVWLDDVAAEAGVALADLGSVTLEAHVVSTPTGTMPTRFGFQVLTGSRAPDTLVSSVNVAMQNGATFVPKTGVGRAWGQILVGGPTSSTLAMIPSSPDGRRTKVNLRLWSEQGIEANEDFVTSHGEPLRLDPDRLDELCSGDGLRPLWYFAESEAGGLDALSVVSSPVGHTSGEHNF